MKIEKAKYEGYIWNSNETTPEILDGEKEWGIEKEDCENPFIVEGILYDKESGRSIRIAYFDGRYSVYEKIVSPSDKESEKVDKIDYVANRMENKVLQFLRYWKEEADDLCEGMGVERPAEWVFVGFKNK